MSFYFSYLRNQSVRSHTPSGIAQAQRAFCRDGTEGVIGFTQVDFVEVFVEHNKTVPVVVQWDLPHKSDFIFKN